MLVDTLALKMHVDKGVVWVLRGCEPPLSTRLCVNDTLGKGTFAGVDTVRVVGSRQNAELIVGLYEQKLKNNIKSVQVVTPLVCSTEADRRRPEAVLYHMRRFNKAPSLGGYHEVIEADFITYSLVSELARTGYIELSDKAKLLLHQHPVWQALSFVNGLHEPSCAQLLAAMIDPRWYVDLCNPDRGAKLQAYFGLVPKTQENVTKVTGKRWRHHQRCQLVRDCWMTPHTIGAVFDTYRAFDIEVGAGELTPGLRPGDFLWRIWGARMGFDGLPPDSVKADLRASQKFLNFLRLIWLAALYRDRKHYLDGSLFRSQDFFLHAVEAEAFDHHILRR
jgi:hypothetical protein